MIPESPFQLAVALSNWRMELEAEPGLTSESRRELEVHLRDSVAELRATGLKEEEAFWLARRRVGRPSELAQEFYKSDPGARARQQARWVALGMLGLYFWGRLSSPIRLLGWKSHQAIWAILPNLFWVVPFALMIYWARHGSGKWWRPRSRKQFVGLSALAIVALHALDLSLWPTARRSLGLVKPSFASLAMNSLWPAALIALVAWLMPAGPRSSQKSV